MSTESTFVPTNHFWVASLQKWVEYEEFVDSYPFNVTPHQIRYMLVYRSPGASEVTEVEVEKLVHDDFIRPNNLIRAASKTLEAA